MILIYGIEYSYRIWCLNISIWPIHRTLTGTSNPCQTRSGTNGNEGILSTPQFSRIGASPSDVVCVIPTSHIWYQLFLFDTNNLYTEMWFQLSLSKSNENNCMVSVNYSYLRELFVFRQFFSNKYSFLLLMVCSWLYSFKYSNLILIIYTHIFV